MLSGYLNKALTKIVCNCQTIFVSLQCRGGRAVVPDFDMILITNKLFAICPVPLSLMLVTHITLSTIGISPWIFYYIICPVMYLEKIMYKFPHISYFLLLPPLYLDILTGITKIQQ